MGPTLVAAYLLVELTAGLAVGERAGLGFCVSGSGPGLQTTRWFLFKADPSWTPLISALRQTTATPERCFQTPMTAVYTGQPYIEIQQGTIWGTTYHCLPGGYQQPGNHGECPNLPWKVGANSLAAPPRSPPPPSNLRLCTKCG